MSRTTVAPSGGIDLTRDMLEAACRHGDGPKPGADSLGYCIAVLHPGQRMWAPSPNNRGDRMRHNQTDRTIAYRWSLGMGYWIGPIETGEITPDDPPIVCTCGIDYHRPEILADHQDVAAAAVRKKNRQEAAERWAASFVEKNFNHGMPLTRDAMQADYLHVYQGLIAQWYADNPDGEERPE